jgi:REP element-mobilizing transposase RayT
MARPLRIEYPGACYHVTCRGNERKKIFSDDRDRLTFLKILSGNAELYNVKIHAYVLMDNHFHLLLMTPEANLQSFMQRFNTTYTVYYNHRHHRSGHFYQGRYKAILIEADHHLLEVSRYLHLNPVRIKKYSKIGIRRKKEIIQRYSWSSYGGYTREQNAQSFVTYSLILEMMEGNNNTEGRRQYKSFVLSGIMKDMEMNLWEEVKGKAVLGSEEFGNWIYKQFISQKKIDASEVSGIKEFLGSSMTMEKIAGKVALEFGVMQEELYLKRASCGVARAVFMELCRLYLGKKMSLAEMGRKMGNISSSAFTQNRKRLMAKLQNDESLREHFQKLKNL